jgi:O-antigen/teichoic acid export membrane protein
MATNQHARLANWFMLTSLLCICLSWLFGYYFDLIGVIVATTLSEMIMAAISIYFALGFISRLNQSETADFCNKSLRLNLGMKWLKKLH